MMFVNNKSEVEHRQQISIKLLICFIWGSLAFPVINK